MIRQLLEGARRQIGTWVGNEDAPVLLPTERLAAAVRAILRDPGGWAVPEQALRLGPLTRGGYMLLGRPLDVRRWPADAMIAPTGYGYPGEGPRWEPWARWWPNSPLWALPAVTATRGAIRFIPFPGYTP